MTDGLQAVTDRNYPDVSPTGCTEEVETTNSDRRFDIPLYTVAEASRAVGLSPSTLANWTQGYEHRRLGRRPVTGAPIVTAVSADKRQPSIPFVGLCEALVLAAVRKAGVPLQRIRPAIEVLSRELGVDHALASRRLFTDGAELLFDYAERSGDSDAPLARQLVVVRKQQYVFAPIVEAYLKLITFADDDYPALMRLPIYEQAEIVADPNRSFGQPIFARGGARVTDVVDRFLAGESIDAVTAEFGVPREELEDVIRASSRRAA